MAFFILLITDHVVGALERSYLVAPRLGDAPGVSITSNSIVAMLVWKRLNICSFPAATPSPCAWEMRWASAPPMCPAAPPYCFLFKLQQDSLLSCSCRVAARPGDALGSSSAKISLEYRHIALDRQQHQTWVCLSCSYPVAARLGDALGVSPTKMSSVAMLGASAGFILPYR